MIRDRFCGIKRRGIAAALAVTICASLVFQSVPLFGNVTRGESASAAEAAKTHAEYTPEPKGLIDIGLGDYIELGTYNGEDILWRCVAFEKATIEDDGTILIDSTQTSQKYQAFGADASNPGVAYLPLMISDRIITLKAFDAKGSATTGSHIRGSGRSDGGSHYWGDSNLRQWLNGTYGEGGPGAWDCGNAPTKENCKGYNGYDTEAGFLNSANFNDQAQNAIIPVTQKTYLSEDDQSEKMGIDATKTMGSESYVTAADGGAWATEYYSKYYYEINDDKMFLLDVQQLDNMYANAKSKSWTWESTGTINGKNYYYGNPTEAAVTQSADSENGAFSHETFAAEKPWQYWLRTPYYNYSNCVRRIKPDGQVDNYNAYYGDQGVRPAFFLSMHCFIYNNVSDTDIGKASNPYCYKKCPGYTEPTAVSDPIYRETASALATAGSVAETSAEAGCEMQYKLVSVAADNTETQVSDWTASVPTAAGLEAGKYKVYWRVKGGTGYFSEEADTQVFAVEVVKPAPTYTAPSAVSGLTYTGSAQALVSGGSVSTAGCTMTYAVQSGDGVKDTAPATNAFGQAVPSQTNAGSYRVWYYVAETDTTAEIAPAYQDVTIAKATASPTQPAPAAVTYGTKLSDIDLGDGWAWDSGGTLPTVTNSGYTAKYTVSDNSNYDWGGVTGYDSVTNKVTRTITVPVDPKAVTADMIAAIADQEYTGSAIEPKITVTDSAAAITADDYEISYSGNTDIGTATVTITGKNNYKGTASKTFEIVKGTPTVTPPTNPTVTPPTNPAEDPSDDPAEDPSDDPSTDPSDPTGGTTGGGTTGGGTTGGTTSGTTGTTTTASAKKPYFGASAKWKGASITLSWTKVTGADGYDVYAIPCGKTLTDKTLNKTVKAGKTSATLTKIGGKTISTKKTYKIRVRAWKYVNGKKATLRNTLTFHTVGASNKTYTNAKKLTSAKTSYALNKGKSATLRITVTKQSAKKKLLPTSHGAALRYYSDNTKVASVTSKGKITAKAAGTCYVYAVALNGVKTKVKVTVK